MNLVRMLVAATAAAVISSAAQATTYNDVTDFSTTSSTGIWSYGTGVTGTNFTPYTNYNPDCLGAGTGCWQTATPVDLVPAVIKNFNGTTVNFGTVVLPNDVLLVHPGPDTDSIVRFTVPVTGTYHVSGFFEILDTNPTGVNAIIAVDDTTIVASVPMQFPAASHPNTPGEMFAFSGTFFAPAGTFIDYGVNNAGNFFDDSTGLSLTFTTVPEPAAWALMLIGVGALGGSLRASRRKVAVAA